MTGRAEMAVSGVVKVRSAEPKEIIANLENGAMIICGENLSVEELNVREGTMKVKGIVNSIKYAASGKKLNFKNIFK